MKPVSRNTSTRANAGLVLRHHLPAKVLAKTVLHCNFAQPGLGNQRHTIKGNDLATKPSNAKNTTKPTTIVTIPRQETSHTEDKLSKWGTGWSAGLGLSIEGFFGEHTHQA